MSAVAVSAGTGRSTAGEGDVTFLPRGGAYRSFYGVVLLHGASYLAQNSFGVLGDQVSSTRIALALAGADLACVAIDAGGAYTFGNDSVVTSIANAAAYLAGLGCKAGKVLLFGGSMGNLSAFRYAQDNPSKVAAIAGVVPACDIDDVRDNNRLGLQSQVNAAWGLPAAATSGTNPIPVRGRLLQRAAAYTGPWKGWYSSQDPAIPTSTITALAALAGISPAAAIAVSNNNQHNDVTVAAVNPADVLAFLKAYA